MVFSARSLYRLISVFLVTSYLLLVTASFTFAQEYKAPNTEPNVPKNLNTYTQNVFIEVINSLNCQLTGINTANPAQKCLGVNPSGQIGFVENSSGLIGLSTVLISSLYTPPASTSDFVRYISSDFGIVKTAHAQNYSQGFGYASIAPLAKIWGIFRNIVYMLFLIVFVVIGLGIMLRLPIDPRTVMGIGNQIPKIIIGIIMVTFSFGIAGFLIDVMWLGTYVTINVIASADNKIDVSKINSKLYDNPIGFANEALKAPPGSSPEDKQAEDHGIIKYAIDGGGSVKDILRGIFSPATIRQELQLPGQGENRECAWYNPICGAAKVFETYSIGNIIGMVIGEIIGHVVGALAVLVFAIALLVALFRLWITLLQAYVLLLIDIVLAPFWLLASLFPGSTFTVGAWFRDMLANLMAFPTAITLLLLGKVFMNAFATTTIASPISVPLIGNPGQQGVLSALIGIGFILLVPTATQMMRDLFKAPKFEYTKTIGAQIGVGTGFAGNVVGGAWGRLWKVSAQGQAVGPLSQFVTRPAHGTMGRFAGYILGTHGPQNH